jgi:hypothetical protein
VVVQSKDGNLAGLVAVLEVETIQRHQLLDQWPQVASTVLLVDQGASEVGASVGALMVGGEEVASEEASKTEEATAAVEEEAWATKEVGASREEATEVAAEIAVGMAAQEAQMDMEHPLQMLLLDPVVHVVVAVVAAIAEGGMAALDPQIATILARRRQLVGMTRVVAVAHMMTDPAAIEAAAVELTEIATAPLVVEVAVTWSQYDQETADTETETAGMVADHATTTHGKELTRAMAMKRILASYEDTRCNDTWVSWSCGGFLEYFFPSSTGVSHFPMHILPR